MLRRDGALLLLVAAAVLSGCASGGPAAPVVSASSPANAAPAPAVAAVAGSAGGFDGLYVGNAVSMRQASVGCPGQITLKNFRVEDNEVRFGGFRGAIEADGSVQLTNRGVWLTGRFSGNEFRGEVTQYGGGGRFTSRGAGSYHAERCIYATALKREAS